MTTECFVLFTVQVVKTSDPYTITKGQALPVLLPFQLRRIGEAKGDTLGNLLKHLNPEAADYVQSMEGSTEVKKWRDFIRESLPIQYIRDKAAALDLVASYTGRMFPKAPWTFSKELLAQKDFAIAVVSKFLDGAKHIAPDLKNDTDVAKAALDRTPYALKDLDPMFSEHQGVQDYLIDLWGGSGLRQLPTRSNDPKSALRAFRSPAGASVDDLGKVLRTKIGRADPIKALVAMENMSPEQALAQMMEEVESELNPPQEQWI